MTPSPLPGSTRSSWPTGHDSISPGYQQGRHTRARLGSVGHRGDQPARPSSLERHEVTKTHPAAEPENRPSRKGNVSSLRLFGFSPAVLLLAFAAACLAIGLVGCLHRKLGTRHSGSTVSYRPRDRGDAGARRNERRRACEGRSDSRVRMPSRDRCRSVRTQRPWTATRSDRRALDRTHRGRRRRVLVGPRQPAIRTHPTERHTPILKKHHLSLD